MAIDYPSLDKPTAGAFRFNTDSSQLEIYRGDQWTGVLAISPEQLTGGTRGLFMGGDPAVNIIDYINISSTGNATDFGDRTVTGYGGACSSRTRGVCAGQADNTLSNVIDYVTISSTGNALDFGDRTISSTRFQGASNTTRAMWFGGMGSGATDDEIDYVTVATTGNAVDFGNLATACEGASGNIASQTRSVMTGGNTSPNSGFLNTIQYITIATTGNTADFGDIVRAQTWSGGASNSIRGIIACGYAGPAAANVNTIEYVTISTLGNAVDFGNYGDERWNVGTVASPTRACLAGGYAPYDTRIEYVQIMTTGDAVEFGDSTNSRRYNGGASNGHGGL